MRLRLLSHHTFVRQRLNERNNYFSEGNNVTEVHVVNSTENNLIHSLTVYSIQINAITELSGESKGWTGFTFGKKLFRWTVMILGTRLFTNQSSILTVKDNEHTTLFSLCMQNSIKIGNYLWKLSCRHVYEENISFSSCPIYISMVSLAEKIAF